MVGAVALGRCFFSLSFLAILFASLSRATDCAANMNNAFFVVSAVTLSVASLPSTTLALPRVPLHSLLGDAPAAPNLTTLQALVDAKAQQYNMSISVGVFSSEFHEFGVASGLADKKGGAAATLDSR